MTTISCDRCKREQARFISINSGCRISLNVDLCIDCDRLLYEMIIKFLEGK